MGCYLLIGALVLSNIATLVALRRARAAARKQRLAMILNQLGNEAGDLFPDDGPAGRDGKGSGP